MSDRTESAASQARQQQEQQTVATAVAEREKGVPLKQITKLSSVFDNKDFMRRLEQAVPKQLSPNRMLRSLIGSVQRSPDLLKCGVLDVVGKMLVCASAGLETDTPLGHAHLIPFRKRQRKQVQDPRTGKEVTQWVDTFICQVIFGYHGLLDLSFRTGMVGTVQSRCVWGEEEDGGHFSFEYGTSRHLRHKPMTGRERNLSPEAQAEGKAEWPRWVYSHATLKEGFSDPFEVLAWGDVEATRNRAQAYMAARSALEKGKEKSYVPATWTEAPWVRHVKPMACKTVFRQLSNWMPRSIELATANAIEDAQERGHVDFGPIIESTSYDESRPTDIMGAASEVVNGSGDVGAAFGFRDSDPQDDGYIPPGDAPSSSSNKKPIADAAAQDRASDRRDARSDVRNAAPSSKDQSEKLPQNITQNINEPAGTGAGAAQEPAEAFFPSDDTGEPAELPGGVEALTTPRAFTDWMADALDKTSRPDALWENNLDALEDLKARFIDMHRELRDHYADAVRRAQEPAPPETTDEPPAPDDAAGAPQDAQDDGVPAVPVPNAANGRPDWTKYGRACLDAIKVLDTQVAVSRWVSTNFETYQGKAIATKIEPAVKARRQEIDAAKRPVMETTDQRGAPAAQEVDREAETAARFLEDIGKITTLDAHALFSESGVYKVKMDRWAREKPDLEDRVAAALRARRELLVQRMQP